MTAAAIKASDNVGGIDNYILGLDERQIQDCVRTASIRDAIASALFHQGKLHGSLVRRFGFHKSPPPIYVAVPTKRELSLKRKSKLYKKTFNVEPTLI